jgi:uncharacterized membrane protein YfcA
MEIYFPIAEMPINVLLLVFLGFFVGVISGFFGIGGGFLMTPLLVFAGVTPAIAVGTQASQLVASSMAGLVRYRAGDNIDYKMALVLLAGGFIGSLIGIEIFSYLQSKGLIDLFIPVVYIVLFGSLSALIMVESIKKIRGTNKIIITNNTNTSDTHPWYITHFDKSNIRVNLLKPLLIGVFIGLTVAILGAGGGFLLIPAMAYIMGMKGRIVAGTSMFQVFFLACFVTYMQATQNYTVDILLATFLVIGGVFGTQLGIKFSNTISENYNRLLLALIVMIVCLALLFKLIYPPESIYTVKYLW